MFADDEGRLWLKEFNPSKDSVPIRGTRYVAGGRWVIIATNGTRLGEITMPDNVSPLAVFGDMLLGIARDALDVEQFVVYTVVR